jgi:hypothetical protein
MASLDHQLRTRKKRKSKTPTQESDSEPDAHPPKSLTHARQTPASSDPSESTVVSQTTSGIIGTVNAPPRRSPARAHRSRKSSTTLESIVVPQIPSELTGNPILPRRDACGRQPNPLFRPQSTMHEQAETLAEEPRIFRLSDFVFPSVSFVSSVTPAIQEYPLVKRPSSRQCAGCASGAETEDGPSSPVPGVVPSNSSDVDTIQSRPAASETSQRTDSQHLSKKGEKIRKRTQDRVEAEDVVGLTSTELPLRPSATEQCSSSTMMAPSGETVFIFQSDTSLSKEPGVSNHPQNRRFTISRRNLERKCSN